MNTKSTELDKVFENPNSRQAAKTHLAGFFTTLALGVFLGAFGAVWVVETINPVCIAEFLIGYCSEHTKK